MRPKQHFVDADVTIGWSTTLPINANKSIAEKSIFTLRHLESIELLGSAILMRGSSRGRIGKVYSFSIFCTPLITFDPKRTLLGV